MSFDLKTLSVDPDNQQAVLPLLHPNTFAPLIDEKGKEVTITLHGPDSTPVKKARRKIQDKNLSQSAKKRKLSLSSEQLELQSLEILVAATASWNNLSYEGDEKCSPENVRKVYENVPWIREQVDEFISERSHFLGK